MSVVKTLALGVSILGSMVAPTLAGSMRASHQIPDRPHRGGHPHATESADSSTPAHVNASAENLAALGGFQPSQNYLSSFAYIPGGFARAVAALSYSNPAAVVPAQPAAIAPVVAPVTTYVAPSAPAAAPAMATTTAASGHTVDAFLNFGNGGYSESQSLTTGSPQAWYQSPAVQSVFHGTPTAAQQAAFQAEVLQTVQNTYNQSGLKISLTTDPTQNYAHTMSVVSGASYSGNPGAIGITDVGNDGFSFIDKFNLAKTPDELATAIGHNVAHELMHAFGIANHPDQTGTYLDAATANWSTLTSASTTFSPQATQMLAAQNFLNGPGKEYTQGANGLTGLEMLTAHHPKFCHCPACTALRQLESAEGLTLTAASPVPEPTTVALWGVAVSAGVMIRRRQRRRGAA